MHVGQDSRAARVPQNGGLLLARVVDVIGGSSGN